MANTLIDQMGPDERSWRHLNLKTQLDAIEKVEAELATHGIQADLPIATRLKNAIKDSLSKRKRAAPSAEAVSLVSPISTQPKASEEINQERPFDPIKDI